MPRPRKIDHSIVETWVAMMTNGADMSLWNFCKKIGIPHQVFQERLMAWNKIRRTEHGLYDRFYMEQPDYEHVVKSLETLYTMHSMGGRKRAHWSLSKIRRAIYALEYAWSLVQLGASGADAASYQHFDWSNPAPKEGSA